MRNVALIPELRARNLWYSLMKAARRHTHGVSETGEFSFREKVPGTHL